MKLPLKAELAAIALKLELENIHSGDVEQDHVDADQALLRFLKALELHEEVELFNKLEKWYA